MKQLTLFLATATLAGCAGAPAAVAPAERTMDVVGVIALQPGATRKLQALVTQNDATTLSRIEVWLKRGDAAAVDLGDLGAAERNLTLNNLRLDTAYAVTLKGFKDDPNDAGTAEVQISDDAASTITFDTNADGAGAYQATRTVTFKLVLQDQTFAGEAGGTIDLDPGTLTSTTAPESLGGND